MRPYTLPGLAAIVIESFRNAQDTYQSVVDLPWSDERRVSAHERLWQAEETLRAVLAARNASGLCCTLHLGAHHFPCDNPVAPGADCSVCQACQDAEETRAANADARAQARHY